MTRQDGGWGWIVVASGFFIGFLCDGIRSSFGLLYIEFLRQFQQSNAVTSWIGSLLFGLMNCFGPVTSVLVHRFGCRAVTVLGGLVCAIGYTVSTFSTSVYYLYVSLGLLGGIGFSMLVIPFNVILVEYFEKRRSLAMGIAICGSGVGSILFSPLSKILIDAFGWRGTLLIEGALLLNCVPCGLVMRPILHESKERETDATTCVETESEMSDSHEVQKTLLQNTDDLKTIDMTLESTPSVTAVDETNILNNVNENTLSTFNEHKQSKHAGEINTRQYHVNTERRNYKEGWFDKINKLIHIRSLTNRIFMWMMISYFFEGLAYSVPFTFLPDMVVDIGHSRLQATWLLSTIAVSNTGIRIPVGLLADLKHVNRIYMFMSALVGTGICIILLAFANAYLVLLCVCAFLGICIGCYVVLIPLVLADLFGDELIADTKGLTCFTNGIANVVGMPIAGVLFDASGNYILTFVIAGLMYMLSGIVLVFTRRHRRQNAS